MADLKWVTTFKGLSPVQDPDPITSVQQDPSTRQSPISTSASALVTQAKAIENAANYNLYLETYLQESLKVLRDKLQTAANVIWGLGSPVRLRIYAKIDLPSASVAGQLVYVTNDVGGATPAYSDGADWRRVYDRAVVS